MRVFVAPSQLVTGEVTISGDEHHYIGIARRCRPGDVLELLDGEGRRATATIVHIRADATVVIAGPIELQRPALPHVRALVPLIKGDRMDFCLEKLVEVGVDEVVVWPAERSVVKLAAAKRAARQTHYAHVMQAAARQSRRAITPAISIADSLDAALSALPHGIRIALDPEADRSQLSSNAADFTIVSGPEGGLAPTEADALIAASFSRMGLGPRVLRAETAPVVAVAVLRAATGS